MISGFVLLHARRVLARPFRVAMAVAGIAAGTSLIVAILAVHSSITTSIERLAALAGGADLEVTSVSDTGLGQTTTDEAAAVPGVKDVAPIVRTEVALDREVVLLLGADERAQQFGGPLADELAAGLRRLAESGAIDAGGVVLTDAMAERLRVQRGDQVDLHSNGGGSRAVPVAGVLSHDILDEVNDGRLVFSSLATAQTLLGRGDAVDAVLVEADDGTDPTQLGARLERRLGTSVLVEDRATREERIAAPAVTYVSQVGPVAAMALLVGGFLVFNTVNMAALERRRELATLRTLGAGRARLVVGLVGEAAVLGLVGAAVGVVVGMVLAQRVVADLPEAMEQAIGVDVSFALPAVVLLIAFVAGAITSVAAALVPALRATRTHPLDAMRPTGTLAGGGEPVGLSWWPFAIGSGLALAGLAIMLTVTGERAASGVLLLALGGVIGSYGAAALLTRFAAGVARRGRGLGHLAASGLERSPHRVWATSMAVALAVAMTLSVGSGARNQLDLDAEHLAELRQSDVIVAARPLDQLSIDTYLPEDWVSSLASLDTIASMSTITTQQAVLDGRSFLLYGAEAEPGQSPFPGVSLATSEAQRRTLDGDAVIISHQFARQFDLDVGDRAEIPGARGTLRLPVAEVVRTLSVSDNGMVVLADDQLREVFGTSGISSVDVTLSDDADPAAARAGIERLAAAQPFPVSVGSGEEAYQAIIGGIVAVQRLMYAILVVTAAVAALAVLNTLAASLVDRWRELGVLRAVGTTPRQLAGMIALEATGVGAVGALVGVIIGEAVHWAGVRYVGNASPLPVEYGFVPEIVLIAALAGIGATIAGALLPVRRASRVDVLDAIAWE